MAYMQFDEVPAMERAVLSGSRGTTAVTGFSALEWSVIALGRMDGVQSLNRPGIVSHAMSAIFGIRPSSSLADERLEALRRTAVVAWHEPVVSASEKAAFIAADFTTAQYDLLLASVADDRLH